MWCSFWCQGSGPISLVSCFSKAFEKCVWKKKVFSCILNCTTCNMVLCREGRWKQIFYHFFNTLARECAPVSKLTPLILIWLRHFTLSAIPFFCAGSFGIPANKCAWFSLYLSNRKNFVHGSGDFSVSYIFIWSSSRVSVRLFPF